MSQVANSIPCQVIIEEPRDDEDSKQQHSEGSFRQHSYSCPTHPCTSKELLVVETRPRSETWDSGIGLLPESGHVDHDDDDHDEKANKDADCSDCDNEGYHQTSIHLSHPLNVLTYSHKSQQLITGNDSGQICVWDDTKDCLMNSFKVAGQVACLDVWNEYIAVGSSTVQLINMNDYSKRVLYMKRERKLMISQHTHHLVSFLGISGHLVSAEIGESTIDLWPPLQHDSLIVTKPESAATLDHEAIVSLSASKQSMLVAVVTCSATGKGLLRILDKQLQPMMEYNPEFLRCDANGVHLCFMSTNSQYPKIGIGEGKMLELLKFDGEDDMCICSTYEAEHVISCLSVDACDTETPEQRIVIGTTGGEVKVLSDDLNDLMSFHNSADHGILSATAIFSKEASKIYAVDGEGTLQIWNERSQPQGSSILIGKERCGEGILTRRQLIQLSKQDLSFDEDEIHLHFPQEALDQGLFLEVAFGMCSPCILPKNMIPVSPLLWLCMSPQKRFTQPVKITLPHCVDCKIPEVSQLLRVMKAECGSIKANENRDAAINFKEIDVMSDFPLGSHHGTLLDYHFCIYCLAYYINEEEIGLKNEQKNSFKNVEYCLTVLKPKFYPRDEIRKIYCIFHYNLKACKKCVLDQKPEHYDVAVLPLRFTTGRYEAAIEIELDRGKAERNGWMITMESDTKIFAEDVNFFNYRDGGRLSDACESPAQLDAPYPKTYPPRFVIEVSQSREPCQSSSIKLNFTGAETQDLHTEVQLIKKEDLLTDCYLTVLKPKEYPKKKVSKIFCIFHLDEKPLSDHIIQEYGVAVLKTKLTRATLIKIKLDGAQAESDGWIVTMESHTTILAKDVIDQSAGPEGRLVGKCQLCDPYSYPEKFVIEVSSREACRSSRIQLNFTGTLPENLSTGVQLHYPIAQTTLQVLDSLGKDHHQMQDSAKVFHSQLNGYCV